MQVSLNVQNVCNYSNPMFKGIKITNQTMKYLLTDCDIAKLEKVDTRKVSKMCMQEAAGIAEEKFFEIHPECKVTGMAKLCRNAIKGKALNLLNSNNERKEIDFEVVTTHHRPGNGFDYYNIDFYSCNFPIRFIVGYGGDAISKDTNSSAIRDHFKDENSASLKKKLDFYSSTEGYKDFNFRLASSYETCYNELVNKNDDIKSLLNSPLYGKVQKVEQLRKEIKESKNTKDASNLAEISEKKEKLEQLHNEIKEAANNTKEHPKLAEIPVHTGHWEEINDEFGSEPVFVYDK